MIVKMFSNANIAALEEEVNAWLSSHKIKVNTVKQSCTGDGKSCYALISIWFEDLETTI